MFRRRKKDSAADPEVDADGTGLEDGAEEAPVGRARGPWDRDETSRDSDDSGYLDLGGIVVRGVEGVELRLQVDEATQAVGSVLLAGPTSGLELRAFAAPRHQGIWDEVRADIVAEAEKRGGTVEEGDGSYGVELRVVVPVKTAEGKQATQASRIVGIEGPRWLLRATFLGSSAAGSTPDDILETALRDVIVVRGDGPMAPRAMLPLVMPTRAREQSEDEDD